jgi:two-component system chemotaxis response regulator CheY
MAVDTSMPILVVDDYQTMVRIIRSLLKQIGFENVDDASNGEAALEKINQKTYGLIISDWNMEPMTGFQLLEKVRAGGASANVPFIMPSRRRTMSSPRAAPVSATISSSLSTPRR